MVCMIVQQCSLHKACNFMMGEGSLQVASGSDEVLSLWSSEEHRQSRRGWRPKKAGLQMGFWNKWRESTQPQVCRVSLGKRGTDLSEICEMLFGCGWRPWSRVAQIYALCSQCSYQFLGLCVRAISWSSLSCHIAETWTSRKAELHGPAYLMSTMLVWKPKLNRSNTEL